MGKKRKRHAPQSQAEAEKLRRDDGKMSFTKLKHKHTVHSLVVEPRPDWHAFDLPQLPGPQSDAITALATSIEALKEHGRALLDQDAAAYTDNFMASSSQKLLGTIMSSGTMADKVSALTLAVRESPLHNMRAFESLLNLASKNSRGQAVYALEAIVDLLGPGDMLPPDRRLRALRNQPGLVGSLQRTGGRAWSKAQALPEGVTTAHLIIWAFEDWLKATYFQVMQLLESWSRDEVGHFRTKALDFVFSLLSEKPEQEANLLSLLVNKLGDKDRRLASRASYLLMRLQSTHPGMKEVIVQTIARDVLFRPGQALRARYYAVNTLNQTVLGRGEVSTADMLLRAYFDLFSALLKGGEMESFTGGEQPMAVQSQARAKREGGSSTTDEENAAQLAEKLISAILTGVNRAAPYVDGDEDVLESRLDVLFRIAHSSNFNTSIQALLLIQHLSSRRNVAVDRFYKTLYESLLDPRLAKSSKHTMYVNLLLRAMKNDSDPRRVKAFAKRMLQVLNLHQAPFASGVLYTLSTLHSTMSPLLREPEEHNVGEESQSGAAYDGRKRDPEYSNAHKSCLWEMVSLLVAGASGYRVALGHSTSADTS
jgi:ribosome biogenesis protein MAK21